MKIVFFFGALIIVMGEAIDISDETHNKDVLEQRILLRKLQNSRSDARDAKSVTWNEILADVLVSSIKIIPVKHEEKHNNTKEPKNHFLTTCFGQVLSIYKSFYDQFKWTDEKAADKPKEEVEIIKPELELESCDDCGETPEVNEVTLECPEGFVKSKEGDCKEANLSKLILSIPNQCPTGYRADRLGFCRILF